MTATSLLSGAHVSLISSPVDGEIATIAAKLQCSAQVGGRGDVEGLLCEMLAVTTPALPPRRTLDLIGHSTPDGLLRLGDWVLDGHRRTVTAFFRELADHDVLGRLGIQSLRLLGCETATTASARSTLCALSEILGIEVFGSRAMLMGAHYTPLGFSSDCMHVLVPASKLRGSSRPNHGGDPYRRTLDIGALPASPLVVRHWPVAIATGEQARQVVQLIRRDDGAYMPDAEVIPEVEIGLPSMTRSGWYHSLHVLNDGSFIRVFPDPGGPGVVFPVVDPGRLQSLVKTLERAR